MSEKSVRVAVTGAGGFIGRHLVRALLKEGHEVVGLEDFSACRRNALQEFQQDGRFRLVEGDAADVEVSREAVRGCRAVFHLAANPEVRVGEKEPLSHVTGNIDPTVGVLEAMRAEEVHEILFTSTSTVYGNAKELPTPEDYGPLLPISVYGGAKLASEGLIAAYAGTFGLRAAFFRFANVVGPEATHGVSVDFVRKLRDDPERLEILGDGTQTKSYVHVEDTVRAMVHVWNGDMPEAGGSVVFNIGSLDRIPVTEVAEAVATVMGLKPDFSFTGAAPGGGGWRGDVPLMQLSVEALLESGWEPRYSSREAVEDTVRWLVENP
jgi:UDP-glucose 4-epimerase